MTGYFLRKAIIIAAVLLTVVPMASCQGSGSGAGNTPDLQKARSTKLAEVVPPKSSPEFSGFDFNFSENTYWKYSWTYQRISAAQGSGPSAEVDTGNFTVRLGPPTKIEGVTTYKVLVTGDSSDPNHDYAPRWQYLAIDDGRILGSMDRTSLEVIFDANRDEWLGGGFFSVFSPENAVEASRGSVDNEFIQTSAVCVQRSSNQTACITVEGQTVCANDTSYDLIETEHYKGGIGPIGYDFYLGSSSSGGGFQSSVTYERHLGLVDTSLKADDGFIPKLPPWTAKADMPTPRMNHSSVAVGDYIFVMGGYDLDQYLNSVEVYVSATNTWLQGPAMPEAVADHTSSVFDGKIYVMGGSTPEKTKVKTVWEYDLQTNTWRRKADMPTPETEHTAITAANFIIVIPADRPDVYFYNAETDVWSYGNSMPDVFASTYYGRTASFIGGRIYVIGGLLNSKFRDECWQLDLNQPYGSQDAWAYAQSMPTSRANHTSAVVANKIYVIGGRNFRGEERTVEEYDPAVDQWTTKYPMPTPRGGMSSAVVNGKIYVIGGRKDNDALATVEEYNPAIDW